MITIQSGKLIIPDEDRFIGFAGDNLTSTKRIVIRNRVLDDSEYTLYLRFDDDSVRGIRLTAEQSSEDLELVWSISSKHLLKAGVVTAQVKIVDSEDVITHTSCDYFVVAGSAAADEGVSEAVTRAEFEDELVLAEKKIPYVGTDGYWYFYNSATGESERSSHPADGVAVDAAMSASSTNPVQNCVLKAYIDAADAAKVDKTTKIAGLELSANISRESLVENISGKINPSFVNPGVTVGYGGQFGKTWDDEPAMCTFMNSWTVLASKAEMQQKMAMAPSVTPPDVDDLATGQLFLCQGGIALKTQNGYIELAQKLGVYSKSEIDAMIGNLESALATV